VQVRETSADAKEDTQTCSDCLQLSPSQNIHKPTGRSLISTVFHSSRKMQTFKVRGIAHHMFPSTQQALAALVRRHTSAQQSYQDCWFHSLTIQLFQALLTLFPKSFSPFPHGTCLLSVSSQCLALDKTYHPIGAPVPRSVTLRQHTVHRGLQATQRTLTHIAALFQEAYTCTSDSVASQSYNSKPEAPIFMLSFSLFIRHYYGNPV
jgi:hypothetical protein